jgi:hypothetical protein
MYGFWAESRGGEGIVGVGFGGEYMRSVVVFTAAMWSNFAEIAWLGVAIEGRFVLGGMRELVALLWSFCPSL